MHKRLGLPSKHGHGMGEVEHPGTWPHPTPPQTAGPAATQLAAVQPPCGMAWTSTVAITPRPTKTAVCRLTWPGPAARHWLATVQTSCRRDPPASCASAAGHRSSARHPHGIQDGCRETLPTSPVPLSPRPPFPNASPPPIRARCSGACRPACCRTPAASSPSGAAA